MRWSIVVLSYSTLALWDGRDGSCLKLCSTLAGRHIGVKVGEVVVNVP